MKRKNKWIVHALLIFFSILFLFPFVWVLLTALKPSNEIFAYPPKILPSRITFENFIKAWTVEPFGIYLKNTMIIVVLSTIGTVLSSAIVAYGFARFDFKGKKILFLVLLSTMMIPWDVTMIPLYMEFNLFGWINTLKPFIIPSFFGGAFFIFLLRQFILTIPKEVEEAARIDGANTMQIFFRIIMPLMKPALILVIVFQILGCWNDYIGPLIFLNDQDKYTLALGLAQFKGVHDTDMASIMAVTSVLCIPPLVLFFAAQKYIVDGIQTTGFKG